MKDEGYKSISRVTTHPVKPEQEPVALRAPNWGHDNAARLWLYRDYDEPFYPPEVGEPLYTTPPQRKPLTYQQIRDLWARDNGLEDCDLCKIDDFIAVVRFVEAAHGIKGEA